MYRYKYHHKDFFWGHSNSRSWNGSTSFLLYFECRICWVSPDLHLYVLMLTAHAYLTLPYGPYEKFAKNTKNGRETWRRFGLFLFRLEWPMISPLLLFMWVIFYVWGRCHPIWVRATAVRKLVQCTFSSTWIPYVLMPERINNCTCQFSPSKPLPICIPRYRPKALKIWGAWRSMCRRNVNTLHLTHRYYMNLELCINNTHFTI